MFVNLELKIKKISLTFHQFENASKFICFKNIGSNQNKYLFWSVLKLCYYFERNSIEITC